MNKGVAYMNEKLRKQIDFVKQGMGKVAAAMRKTNAVATVSGERRILPLADRNISIVYYPAPSQNAPLIIVPWGWLYIRGCCHG